ncbi:hypothetical protein AB0K18_10095 [Nonomuraea sp. NPDC049421]|uniref:hypothetical protein n=1 Tax=Nonomuraea sp. NPDC049421 TaxID=3155275 RepID=UPI0034329A16
MRKSEHHRNVMASWRRSRFVQALVAVGVATLLSVTVATPVWAAVQEVGGARGTVYPARATICAGGGIAWARVYYTESEIPGKEIGNYLTATTYQCKTGYPITVNSRFRSFHVCNSLGTCGPEVYL